MYVYVLSPLAYCSTVCRVHGVLEKSLKVLQFKFYKIQGP